MLGSLPIIKQPAGTYTCLRPKRSVRPVLAGGAGDAVGVTVSVKVLDGVNVRVTDGVRVAVSVAVAEAV